MNDFNNRIDAQREILNIINTKTWSEELFGLSSGALDRWIRINGIDHTSALPNILREAADKLFFLANKSQEQVTEEYRMLSQEIFHLTQRVSKILEATQL